MIDRRAGNVSFQLEVTDRLSAIETSQKLYHAELKSIIENLYRETENLKTQYQMLHRVIFGGPPDTIGLLESFRSLLTKTGIYTTVAMVTASLILRLFGPALTKAVMKLLQ